MYAGFGPHPWVARILQAGMGAAGAACLASAAARWGGARAGWIAGAIAALYAPWIFFDGEILIPSLLLFLLCGALWALSRARSGKAAAVAGGFLGLAGIARPNALVLLPVAAVYAAGRRAVADPAGVSGTEAADSRTLGGPAADSRTSGGPAQARRSWSRAAWVLGLGLLPAAVVTAINVGLEGAWVPVASQGGVNFYAGNHDGATGRSLEVPELRGLLSWREFVARSETVAEAAAGHPLDSAQVSAWWFDRGLDWIRGHPREALRLYARKLIYLVNGHEVPDNRSLYFERPGILRGMLWEGPGLAFPWGLLFPLAVAGFAATRRIPALRGPTGLLGAWWLVYAASLLPFFITARYRMGLVPPMILLAGLAFVEPRRLVKPLPLVLFVVAFVAANGSWADVRVENRAQEMAKQGDVLLRDGRVPEAITALEASRELDGREPVTAYLLARAYHRAGRVEDAAILYSRLAGMFSEDATFQLEMGRALLELGKLDWAVRSLEKAAKLRPDDPRIWARLETAYRQAGRADDAERARRELHRLDPSGGL